MKGMVFTHLIDLMEEKVGIDKTEDVLSGAELPNEGAYTSVGTYDYRELIRIVGGFSAASGVSAPELVHALGRYLFPILIDGLSEPLPEGMGLFAFLESVHNHIHVQVRKLYPDADLPDIETQRDGDRLVMTYSSARPFADLAHGLIEGSIRHFGEEVVLDREDLSSEGRHTRFTLSLAA